VATPQLISLDDVERRVEAVGGSLAPGTRRLLFTQASASANRTEYARRMQALFAADMSVALARFRVQEALEAHERQLAMLRSLQQVLGTEGNNLTELAGRLTAARDSLTRLAALLEVRGNTIRQMFRSQISSLRLLAGENLAAIDSVRRALEVGPLVGGQGSVLDLEAQTAQTYRAVADDIERGIEGAIGHHPTFALRDSVRARSDRLGRLLTETQGALAAAQQALQGEIARLEQEQPAGPQRATLASAESQRAAAENALVAVVDAELNARATELVAELRRDTEAAQFGVASATFFQALDAGQTPGTSGTSGSTGASGASGASTSAGVVGSATRTTPPTQPK
jgi:hypothetical protein